MLAYQVRPFDVIYFRGNKSFDFGEWYSGGVFPPYPSTFQGFVRTLILKKAGHIQANGKLFDPEKSKELVGDDTKLTFDITGPFLLDFSKSFHLKIPLDIAKIGVKDGQIEGKQISLSSRSCISDLQFNLLSAVFSRKPDYAAFHASLCSFDELNNYRRTGTIQINQSNPSNEEPHVGICLKRTKDRKNTFKLAEDGLFYLTPYHRLKSNIRFYFQINGNDSVLEHNLEDEYGKLGSESRGAVVERCDKPLNLKLSDEFYSDLVKQKRFKLVLVQPGLFHNGWLPFTVLEKNRDGYLVLDYKGLKIKLLYARTGEIQKISGMSMRKQVNNSQKQKNYGLKPMLSAVPAGAVYYFEILDLESMEDTVRILKELDGSKIENLPYSSMGFNQVVLGKII